jgi:hypothetical protein
VTYSPAPWNTDSEFILNAENEYVAQVIVHCRPFEDVLADAALIAKAPTMHAILTRMIEAFLRNDTDEGVLALQEAAEVLGRWDAESEEVLP